MLRKIATLFAARRLRQTPDKEMERKNASALFFGVARCTNKLPLTVIFLYCASCVLKEKKNNAVAFLMHVFCRHLADPFFLRHKSCDGGGAFITVPLLPSFLFSDRHQIYDFCVFSFRPLFAILRTAAAPELLLLHICRRKRPPQLR